MTSRKGFLPLHPKIIRKIPLSPGSPSLAHRSHAPTHRSNASTLTQPPQDEQQIITLIIKKQQETIEQLQATLAHMKAKNEGQEYALTHFNANKQMEEWQERIDLAKQEQAALIQKIQNCERIEQTTTSEEYYIWQKKKKTDEYNRRINEAFYENHQEKKELEKICQAHSAGIENQNKEIERLVEEINRLQRGDSDSDDSGNLQEVDQKELALLKEEHDNLATTVEFMKESNEILFSQFNERIGSMQKHLKLSFTNSKSSLVRDLQTIKKEIEDGEPSPPQPVDKEIRSTGLISDYESKMKELRSELSSDQLHDAEQLLAPFDWRSLKWEQYAVPPEALKETEQAYDTYMRMERELEQLEEKMDRLYKQLTETSNDTMAYQDKKNSMDGEINRMLRLSLSQSNR